MSGALSNFPKMQSAIQFDGPHEKTPTKKCVHKNEYHPILMHVEILYGGIILNVCTTLQKCTYTQCGILGYFWSKILTSKKF